MKAILEFDLNEHHEKLAHLRALNGTSAYIAFHVMVNHLFRPARKHGYVNGPLMEETDFLNSALNGENGEQVAEVISALEKAFNGIIEHYGINLNDLE